MKSAARIIGTAVLCAAIAVVGAAQDSFNLKRVAKEGDAIKYKMTFVFDFNGQEASFSGTVSSKVKKVDTEGNITVESTQSEGKVKLGDQEFPAPGGTSTTTTKATGEVLEAKSDQGDNYRMENMMSLIVQDASVKVGDKWSREFKADEKKGTVAAKAEYEVVGLEKTGGVDTVKVKLSYKETAGDAPAVATGHAWLDPKDGSLVKLVIDVQNMPINGAPMPLSGKMTMEKL